MENNSSRRSSNDEHQLITSTLWRSNPNQKITIHRKGIQYDDCDGVRYCDYRIDFNRYYNTHREYSRLIQVMDWVGAKRAWIELGKRQRELMWRLQFLCQQYLPFYPIPNFHEISNRREFTIFNDITQKLTKVFAVGPLINGLGFWFSLYKGETYTPKAKDHGELSAHYDDLIAICRLCEREKEAVAEFKPDQYLQPSFELPNRLA